MANTGDLIQELFRGQQGPLHSLAGEVISVDESSGTCDVRPFDGSAEVLGVRLYASPTSHQGLKQVPRVGSVVVVTFLNQVTGFVSLVSEPEHVSVILGTTEVFVDNNGVRVKRGNEDLFSIINDLLTEILALTVTTGVGPSGTPINAVNFGKIKVRLNTLLMS